MFDLSYDELLICTTHMYMYVGMYKYKLYSASVEAGFKICEI